jgi:hypothetical protein
MTAELGTLDALARALADECESGQRIVGLGDAELDELQAALGGNLPSAYRDFMRKMGRSAGPLLAGTDAFYPEIIEYQEDAAEVAASGGASYEVPAGAIIFAIHQGYQIYWMPSGCGDDPPVFLYQEEDSKESAKWESFSKFVLDEYSKIYRPPGA